MCLTRGYRARTTNAAAVADHNRRRLYRAESGQQASQGPLQGAASPANLTTDAGSKPTGAG